MRDTFFVIVLLVLVFAVCPCSAAFTETGYMYSDDGAVIHQEAQSETGVPGILHFGRVDGSYSGWQTNTNNIVQGYAEYEKKTVISGTYGQTGPGLHFDGLAIYSDAISSQNLQGNGTGTFCSFAVLPSEQFMFAEAGGSGRSGHYKNDKLIDGTTFGFSTLINDVDDTDKVADASIAAQIRLSTLSGFYPNSSTQANYNNRIENSYSMPGNATWRVEWMGTDFSNPYNLSTNKTSLAGQA